MKGKKVITGIGFRRGKVVLEKAEVNAAIFKVITKEISTALSVSSYVRRILTDIVPIEERLKGSVSRAVSALSRFESESASLLRREYGVEDQRKKG